VDYPLEEILILCLLAVLAGADTITDIALFGRKKVALRPSSTAFTSTVRQADHLVRQNCHRCLV
jgi:hypothetical protein